MTTMSLQNTRSDLTGTLVQRMMQLLPVNDKRLHQLEVPPPESLSSASPRMLIDLFEEVRQPTDRFKPLKHILDDLHKTEHAGQRFMMAEQILDVADSFLYKSTILTWIELQLTRTLRLTLPYVSKYINQINLGLDQLERYEKEIKDRDLISDYRKSVGYQFNFITTAISILNYFDPLDALLESASYISSLGPKIIDMDGNVAVAASPVRYSYACRLGRSLMRSANKAVWLTDHQLYLGFELSKQGRPKKMHGILDRFLWPLTMKKTTENSALTSAMRFLGWSLRPKLVGNFLAVRIDFSKAK